jgi:hypothetical protein
MQLQKFTTIYSLNGIDYALMFQQVFVPGEIKFFVTAILENESISFEITRKNTGWKIKPPVSEIFIQNERHLGRFIEGRLSHISITPVA